MSGGVQGDDHVLAGLRPRLAIPPVAALMGTALVVGVAAGWPVLGERLGAALPIWLLVGLNLALVVLLLAWGERRSGILAAASIALGLLGISILLGHMLRVGFFATLDWNWQYKTVELLWLLALIAMMPQVLREEIGWRLSINPGTLGSALVNIFIWFVIGIVLVVTGGGLLPQPGTLTVERVLFDTTYPNLVEEILFRGLILALLDRALPPRWSIFGARIGWGVVLTALLFGLVHGISAGPDSPLVFDPVWLGQTFAMGLVLGWIRALTGSLWPAFLGHAAPEIGIVVGLAIMGAG